MLVIAWFLFTIRNFFSEIIFFNGQQMIGFEGSVHNKKSEKEYQFSFKNSIWFTDYEWDEATICCVDVTFCLVWKGGVDFFKFFFLENTHKKWFFSSKGEFFVFHEDLTLKLTTSPGCSKSTRNSFKTPSTIIFDSCRRKCLPQRSKGNPCLPSHTIIHRTIQEIENSR